MSIRPATETDLLAIARIHKDRFADHLLGRYSVGLLTEFYRAFLDGTILLVHEDERGVDGFVLGGEAGRLAECRKAFLRANPARCLLETLCRPAIWAPALRQAGRLLLGRKTRTGSAESMRLLSIAVDRRASGQGVGCELIRAFEAELGDRWTSYGLSVKDHNTRAIAFYRKCGFEEEFRKDRTIYFRKNVPARAPLGEVGKRP